MSGARQAGWLAAGTLVLGLALVACRGEGSAEPPANSGPAPDTGAPAVTGGALRYVALGDSYTIGTSVGTSERWPDQLVAALGPEPPSLTLLANVAVNGFTSGDVMDVELPQLEALSPEFVSLLIGVNDVVRGVPEVTFRRNVTTILDDLVARVGPERIVVVTTPDYTVTPAGAEFGDPAQQAANIRDFNAAMTTMAEARGIVVVDIHDISLRAAADSSLVAGDGLHPSGAQYALWVQRILPVVAALLGR